MGKYRKKEKPYNKETIKLAVLEIVSEVGSVKKIAQKYHMSRSMLRKRVIDYKSSGNFIETQEHRGKQTLLPPHLENKFAFLLREMEKMGLGPSRREFLEIIKDYLQKNDIKTPFREDKPGKDWLFHFMKRHNFSLKKGGQMQIARKRVTSDPFVIFGFFEILRKEAVRLNIVNRPECFWNLDETSFPTDPSRTKTIGTTGEKTVRVTAGAQRENITVLATCCATGKVLPPLVVFSGTRMLHGWIGKKALEGTEYSVSKNGWMTRDVFDIFFANFIIKTKEIRPLILIIDGHVSHTSLCTIEKAIENNISILKLPPHCTDLLQPLDVACFSPLKNYYEQDLDSFRNSTGGKVKLEKDAFVDMLSLSWNKGLNEKNVKSGFQHTGIYPIDETQYKKQRLDPVKLKTYEKWVKSGSPSDENNNPILTFVDPENVQNDFIRIASKDQQPISIPSISTVHPSQPHISIARLKTQISDTQIPEPEAASHQIPDTPRSNSRQTPQPRYSFHSEERNKSLKEATVGEVIAELKLRAPDGTKYVVINTVDDDDSVVGISSVLQARGSRRDDAGKDRRYINMNAQIITQEECVQAIKLRNEADKEKEIQKKKRKDSKLAGNLKKVCLQKLKGSKEKPCPKPNKRIQEDIDSTTSEDSELMTLYSSDDDSLKLGDDLSDQEYQNVNCISKIPQDFTSKANVNKGKYLKSQAKIKKISNSIDPLVQPKIDDDCIDLEGVKGYYAVYYTDPLTHYWGIIAKIFSEDNDTDVNKVEIHFLQKKTISSDLKQWSWIKKKIETKHDKDVVSVKFVFYGPVKGNYEKGGILCFPEEVVRKHLISIAPSN